VAYKKRLTAPGAAAEDTESTVVFLYSKEKHGILKRLLIGAPLGVMLHYNVVFPDTVE
jgi:hypothetical protein